MPERIVPAVWLNAHPLETVGNEQLPTNGLPFTAETLGQLAVRVPWVIENEIVTDEPLQPALLLQPSEEHQRAFEVDLATLANTTPSRLPRATTRVIWQDEFGNPYGSLGYKGTRGQRAAVFAGTTDPKGLRFYGLQTTYALERCLKASRLLRERGVETEYITGAYLPDQIPHEHGIITHADFKTSLYMAEGLANALSDNQPSTDRHPHLTDEQLKALHTALTEASFVATARGMLVPERLLDLATNDKATANRMLQRAMRIGTVLGLGNEQQLSNTSLFIGEVIASRLGRHIGTMHTIGLAHRMLHTGNITLTGGIIDLDSVVGAGIGLEERDQQVSAADALVDFSFYLTDRDDSIFALLDNLQRKQLITSANETYKIFVHHLYTSYMATQHSYQGDTPISLSAEDILPVIAESFMRARSEVGTIERILTQQLIDMFDAHGTMDVTRPGFETALFADCLTQLTEHGYLQPFMEAFRGIMPHQTLLAAAHQSSIDKANKLEATKNDSIPALTHVIQSVAEAYVSCAEAARSRNTTSPFADAAPCVIGGCNLDLSAEVSLGHALEQAATLPITAVHMRHHNRGTTPADLEISEAFFTTSAFASNMSLPALQTFVGSHRRRSVSDLAHEIRRNNLERRPAYIHNSRVGRVRRVETLETAGDTYLLYLAHTGTDIELYIETFGVTVDIAQLLDDAQLSDVPVNRKN